jgi:hypothetical protein
VLKKNFHKLLSQKKSAGSAAYFGDSHGPWKFQGLPGLILKLTVSQHYFECSDIEKTGANPMGFNK